MNNLSSESIYQELAEVNMGDTFIIGRTQKWCGWDDILWIGIADILERSKLSVGCNLTINKPGYLNIQPLVGTGADKVYLTVTELTYGACVAQMNEMMLYDILYNFLYVWLTLTANYIIA